jgi:hypothetical protein
MQEVQVDVNHRRRIERLVDDVVVPNFFEERGRHVGQHEPQALKREMENQFIAALKRCATQKPV